MITLKCVCRWQFMQTLQTPEAIYLRYKGMTIVDGRSLRVAKSADS
jgi:hypothetical protein